MAVFNELEDAGGSYVQRLAHHSDYVEGRCCEKNNREDEQTPAVFC